MQAAVLYEYNKPLQIETFDMPEVGPDQLLVKLVASGVCHSDYHVVKGDWPHIPMPTILGHEGAGIIEEVGSEISGVQKGDHVVLTWKLSCGVCFFCQQGFINLCEAPPDMRSLPRLAGTQQTINKMIGLGTFGHYTVVPRNAVILIDKDVPLETACVLGCAVMTGIGSVVNTAQVVGGSSVAVFGCGGVGLNCLQGAALVGAEPVIAVDIYDHKLETAKVFGATHTINALKADPVEAIVEISKGGVDYAFEAIGLRGETIVQAILSTRRRGMIIIVGQAPFDTPVALDARMLMHEKMVMGSYYGTARPQIDFPKLIKLYKSGKIKLDELISRKYPLEQVNEAFEALGRGEVARSILALA